MFMKVDGVKEAVRRPAAIPKQAPQSSRADRELHEAVLDLDTGALCGGPDVAIGCADDVADDLFADEGLVDDPDVWEDVQEVLQADLRLGVIPDLAPMPDDAGDDDDSDEAPEEDEPASEGPSAADGRDSVVILARGFVSSPLEPWASHGLLARLTDWP